MARFRARRWRQDNAIDPGEKGLPDLTVDAVRGTEVIATTTTAEDGSFAFPDLDSGSYTIA